ncbi:unnamed protein product [Nezara viridula]|uniref:BTB domain-containing protein n=1 Tax=Nezara viridula TaxID=85310 RepID=A0A9P0HJG0_NEZVI|nr:unnamed protein product [Nezara viridula]
MVFFCLFRFKMDQVLAKESSRDEEVPIDAKEASDDEQNPIEVSKDNKLCVNEEKLNRSLEVILSPSVRTKEIYKALTFIRTKVVEDVDGVKLLHKLGGCKSLVKVLSNNNEDILNITISILGNLCNHLIMNEDFREEITKNKVAGRLVSILRKTAKTSIQKRLCRFIGNLAQSHSIAKDLHSAGVSLAIVHVLNTTEDSEVQHMAIRALRWLWEVDKHHNDMLRNGVVMAVSIHLTSKDDLVLKAVLRTLVKVTQHYSIYTAEQITGKGTGYSEIVSKIDMPVVPVLICNLSYDPRARIELCKAGAVEAIIKLLEEGKTNSYLITGLCQMCRESMVRASLRLSATGFNTLLSLLSNKKSKHFYPEILDAITQFNYDQASLMKMVRCGLINVLVEKLSEYAKVHCCGHSEAVAAEAMGPLSPQSPASWAASPSPPPLSPTNQLASSQDYSPRCSTPNSDSSSSPIPSIERPDNLESPVGLDGCILEVLSRLTYQGIPMRALANRTTVTTFLDYLTGLPYPRYRNNFVKATRALTAIVMCKHYWNTILDDESVLDIHRRLCRVQHEDCWECKRLQETGLGILREIGLTAQSGLGEGEITYRLMGISSSSRITAALTIPHVIRQPNLLYILLYTHNALKVVMETLSTRIDEAVPSLHSLFATLAINNPQQSIQMCNSCEIGRIRKEGNVLFTLDDGSTVSANKESLSHSCPVFEAMFRGGFKESLQSSVRLSDISADCLSHLTKVLHEYCSCALPKDLSVLLEMISVSDRFLLPDLTVKVLSVVRDNALSHATANQIYDWGLNIGQQFEVSANLSEDVVKYMFTGDMLPSQRVSAVSRILESDNKDRFLEDLRLLIKSGIVAYTKTHRFPNYKS